MLLSRRAVSVAARRLAPRASCSAIPARFYATEATASQTSETPATTAAAKAAPAPSKWAKAKTTTTTTTAKLASAVAGDETASPPVEADLLYQPKTIAHTAEAEGSPPPADAAGTPIVDWANSFHGISSKPVTEEQFRVLMAPLAVKDIEVKPDGVIYLPEIKYRRRLNETFGPMGWGMIPQGRGRCRQRDCHPGVCAHHWRTVREALRYADS